MKIGSKDPYVNNQEVHFQGTVMYFNNEYKTPKDRISDSLRERLLEEEMDSSEVMNYITHLNNGEKNDCTCKDTANRSYKTTRSELHPLAMIYSAQQGFDALYCDDEALQKGSLFSSLYFPFEANCCGGTMMFGNGGCRK